MSESLTQKILAHLDHAAGDDRTRRWAAVPRDTLLALLDVASAAEMSDARYRDLDSNGEEFEGCYLRDALERLHAVMGGRDGEA